MKVFLIGYPGEMGGANTEALHTIALWRRHGVDVDLVPTWGHDAAMETRLDAMGCRTHHVKREQLETVPGLARSICVGMCNSHCLLEGDRLRAIGCPIVWVNCMNFLFPYARRFFEGHGPTDAMVYQSDFQRSQLEPLLAGYGYDPATGYLIRGAFESAAWKFSPRAHDRGEAFVVGRHARPAPNKWSSNTWSIYQRINYQPKTALMLGVDRNIHNKLGKTPEWAQCLVPRAMPVDQYLARLHCLLPINGGDVENWPRAGLEAMAAGVPIVAEDRWGWREMILHGETGFLGSSDAELAHWAAVLAYDEPLRLHIAQNARARLVDDLADPETLWAGWKRIFDRLSGTVVLGQLGVARPESAKGVADCRTATRPSRIQGVPPAREVTA